MRPDHNLALDLWQHESTHVRTDGRWREVELFLPADLNLSEVTDYPHSAILLNASEAGEFVARLSVSTEEGCGLAAPWPQFGHSYRRSGPLRGLLGTWDAIVGDTEATEFVRIFSFGKGWRDAKQAVRREPRSQGGLADS
jgi:hypothetical protein